MYCSSLHVLQSPPVLQLFCSILPCHVVSQNHVAAWLVRCSRSHVTWQWSNEMFDRCRSWSGNEGNVPINGLIARRRMMLQLKGKTHRTGLHQERFNNSLQLFIYLSNLVYPLVMLTYTALQKNLSTARKLTKSVGLPIILGVQV